MTHCDADYYQMRAEQEIELAQRATTPEVVAAHYRLSELYLARLASLRGSTEDDQHQIDHATPAIISPPHAERPVRPEDLPDRDHH